MGSETRVAAGFSWDILTHCGGTHPHFLERRPFDNIQLKGFPVMMKLLLFALVALHVVDFGAGQCRTGWTYRAPERCMRCSSSLGLGIRNHAEAETACNNVDANLATITTAEQNQFARDCGAGLGGLSWMGFMTFPTNRFIDGTLEVAFTGQNVVINDVPNQCFVVQANSDFDDANNCAIDIPFTCTQDAVSCPNLETVSPLSVGYTNTGDGTPPAGKQWMDTLATYSCSTGYSLSGGTATRTCQNDETWSGSLPSCIAAGSGTCAPLPEPGYSMINYNSVVTAAGTYVVGTIASQMCNDGYDMESGTTMRTCMATGMWSGSAIVCDKDNDALAIGLGVGLSVLVLAVVAGLLAYCFCRRQTSAPRPYPRPRSGYPRARRNSYPRRYRERD